MYKYEDFREQILTDEGQRTLIQTRDEVFAILEQSGAITMEKAMGCTGAGDTWQQMSYIDRLVEIGDLFEIALVEPIVTQHRVFVRQQR